LVLIPGVAPLWAVKPVKRARKQADSAVVTRAQMELAQQMARDAYRLSQSLEARQRVALLTRLLYTMRPEVLSEEKAQWAEELFAVAQQLPRNPDAAAEVDDGRSAAIATAAARLAVYDAGRALELLDTLPEENGSHAGARVMAARLVFAGYMQHHGPAGAQVLLAHGRRWSEHGGFPYAASAVALARLRPDEDAAEEFFLQEFGIFKRGQEGIFGISDFAALLEQAAAMEAISEESAEKAGAEVVRQLRKFADEQSEERREKPLTEDEKRLLMAALDNVRVSAPRAYEAAHREAPALLEIHAVRASAVVAEAPRVDPALQTAFRELASAMAERRSPEALRGLVNSGMALINARYTAGAACAGCYSPDAQSWALVALAAHAAPMTLGIQLKALEAPFWRAYFTAIAAQQVGQPTKVADPTARKLPGKEEAEPE
jgi:hypothetical protein